MVACLIGSTGFVGSNLRKQMSFEECYNSTNITDIEGKHFDLVICCGASAKKWWANQNEAADLAQIESLIKSLTTVTATRFVLISTIDVYPQTTSEDEDCAIEPVRNHPYGRHRYLLEEFVRTRFAEHNIVYRRTSFTTSFTIASRPLISNRDFSGTVLTIWQRTYNKRPLPVSSTFSLNH